MKVYWYIFFSVVLLAGCEQKPYRQQLVDFINDPQNKIIQSIQVGNIKATAKWLPFEYRNMAAVAVNQPLQQEDYYYFDIRFETEALEKPTKEKVLYLDFDMQNDFKLYCNGDSLLPSICQKIENGRSGSYQYIVAFENRRRRLTNEDFTMIYNDKIFGIGALAFAYRQKDIRKIPRPKTVKG